MGFEDGYVFYASYHSDDKNKLVHMVFVPIIMWSAFLWLTQYDASAYLPPHVVQALPPLLPPNAALLVAAVYVFGYLIMSPWYGPLGAVLVTGLVIHANLLAGYFGPALLWKVAIAAHVLSWAAQFYAHDKFEGRQPALFSSLFQSLFMAPLFVCIEYAMALGAFRGFHKRVQPRINRSMRRIIEAERAASRGGGAAAR